MSAPFSEYPDDLKLSVWDKKKGSLPDGAEVSDKLKALQKKHDGIDWKQFDAGWPKGAKSAAELEQAFALRDRLYRSNVFALKKDVLGLVGTAKALEKGAAKPVLDAAKAIGKAANAYAAAIDEGVDELKAVFDKARAALPKDAQDEEDDEDAAPNKLLDPKQLFKQLTLCRRDPERTMNFAFVDAKGKEQPAMLALHAKVSPRKLFGNLQVAAGVKTGAYGSAWVDGMSLMLQLDKPMSGLVKKVRGPVKAAGFKITKAVLWNEDGTVFEQDDETDAATEAGGRDGASTAGTAPEPAAAASRAPASTRSSAAAAYEARRAELMPRVRQATAAGSADSRKFEALLNFAADKAEADDAAGALLALGKLEKLLDASGSGGAEPRSAGAGAAEARPASATTGDAGGVKPGAAFTARLAALMPQVTRALAAGGASATALKNKVAEAGGAARDKQFDTANALLDEAEKLLAGAAASSGDRGGQATGEATAEAADEAAWLRRFAATETAYLAVLARNPADANRLRMQMDVANEHAGDRRYAQALQSLERLDALIAGARDADDTGYAGMVAYRKALVKMDQAVIAVNRQIDALQAAIPAHMPDEDDLADALADELGEFTDELRGTVDAAMNASENDDSPVTRAIASAIERFQDDLKSNPLVKHVDGERFGVKVSIAGTLGPALAAVRAAMPAMR